MLFSDLKSERNYIVRVILNQILFQLILTALVSLTFGLEFEENAEISNSENVSIATNKKTNLFQKLFKNYH